MRPSVAMKSSMWPSVENVCPPLPYDVTSRARREKVVIGEMTLQPNYSKSFLKWRFSSGQSLARVKSSLIRDAAYCIVFSHNTLMRETQTRIWKHWQLYLHAIQWYRQRSCKISFGLFLRQLYPAHVNFCWRIFSQWDTACFIRHSTHCSAKSWWNWLQSQ